MDVVDDEEDDDDGGNDADDDDCNDNCADLLPFVLPRFILKQNGQCT